MAPVPMSSRTTASTAACSPSRASPGRADFPYQDESEIHDSTRKSAPSVEASLYVLPRFLLEVAKNWRSFNTARTLIGTCPYLLLTWMVSLDDEATVAGMNTGST